MDLGVLFVSNVAGTTITSTTTETTLPPAGRGNLVLPANYFTPGTTLRWEAWGQITFPLSSDTIRIRAKLGSVAACDTTAVDPSAAAVTNGYWLGRGLITCRTTGVSGTVIGTGTWECRSDDTVAGANRHFGMGTAVSTVDTTAALTFDLTAQWSVASAGLAIVCQTFMLATAVS
jgi:hypothetical protein